MMRLQKNESRKKRNNMTKFEELTDLITPNKNRKVEKISTDDKEDSIELEVSGSESTNGPLLASASDELDPDLIDMLYTKPRHKPLDGSGASAWDSDY
jgi:hypothetical protein